MTKKVTWKKEDEENMNNILYILNQLKDTSSYKEDDIAEKTIDWLKSLKDRFEKQDKAEQKPYEQIKSPEESLRISSKEYNEIVNDCFYSESKPTDKVKPKFKVGDWIVDNCGYVWKIERIINCFYILKGVDENESQPTIEWIDKTAHLWSIKDAKDGDILVYGDNPIDHHVEVTIIFKSVRNKNSVFTHFHIFDDKFRTDDWCDCGENVHPATKEQRDFLFFKIKEAGYKWDKENKELKNIENKIEIKIEIPFGVKDSELQEYSYYIPKGFYAEIDDDKVVIKKDEKHIDWLEKQGPPEPEENSFESDSVEKAIRKAGYEWSEDTHQLKKVNFHNNSIISEENI